MLQNIETYCNIQQHFVSTEATEEAKVYQLVAVNRVRTKCIYKKISAVETFFIMSPQEEKIALAAAAYIILSKKTKKKRKHKCWIRPSLQERNQHGGLQLLDVLRRDDLMAEQITDGHIQNFLRISSTDLEWLLCRIEPMISKCDTNYRAAISAVERLLVTLRFLATGDSYHSLMYLFRISTQSISRIVPEVCAAIVEVLSDQVKVPENGDEWKAVECGFNSIWNFPKCVGVMDGKHIMIQSPGNSGSDFFNYKSFFSVVLFVVANANYEVLYLNVGCQGRISDGGVFANTRFKKMLTSCKLNLPEESPLPGRTKAVPYVFLGDDAFPLSPNLLKPFPGAQEKGSYKRIFNYRLSRARRVSENVFGILATRFRILRKPMLLNPEKVGQVVTACIFLHKFLRRSNNSKKTYTPPNTFDSEDKDTGQIIPGTWRLETDDNSVRPSPQKPLNATTETKYVREEFAEYFMLQEGRVTWQDEY